MSPNFEYIAVVLDDYCDMQTSGFIPTANRYPVADVQEQVALLGQLEPAGNAVLANRIAELEREVSMHRNAEITWEKTMMQAVGEDGPKSVVEAIDKIKAERDSIMQEAKIHASELDTQKSIVVELCGLLELRVHDYHCINKAKQAIQEIRAQAGRVGYVECANDFGLCGSRANKNLIDKFASQYADSILKGEVK